MLVYFICMIVIYLISYRKYQSILSQLDIKVFPFKNFLHLGLFILETFKFSFNTSYDRKLLGAIVELYGNQKAVLLLKVHWGNKITLVMLSLLFAFFVGNFTEPDAGYITFILFLPVAIAVFTDRDLFEKVKKRRQIIQLEFPDFVNKLTLLINAGMTISKAWEKIAADNSRKTPLYMEVGAAIHDIRSGIPEHKAYEEFAKRCKIPVITRFITVILQNIRKGNAELVPILRVYANECWELRKTIAKRFGEEASTKLLLPIMLMFVAILLIVGMPAVLALKNI